MRTIAVVKECTKDEKSYIISSVNEEDKVLFFKDEKDLLNSSEVEDIDIVLGEPDLSTVSALKKLRWLQMSWAGANKYTASDKMFENICLTSASGAYGFVISEYIVAGILALYRNMFLYRDKMQAGLWEKIDQEDTIEGKRALILGTGDIGFETAKRLKCFGAYTVGMSRTCHDKMDCFDEMYTIESLNDQLRIADLVIIAMPGTSETSGMFDDSRFSVMKPGAMIVNVGRGFIVKTDALVRALQNGIVGGAVIDVADPEPLPENHSLRNMKNVVLTPHISGIGWGTNMHTRKKILDIFCDNLQRDYNGEELRNIISFSKGY